MSVLQNPRASLGHAATHSALLHRISCLSSISSSEISRLTKDVHSFGSPPVLKALMARASGEVRAREVRQKEGGPHRSFSNSSRPTVLPEVSYIVAAAVPQWKKPPWSEALAKLVDLLAKVRCLLSYTFQFHFGTRF
jgi:hypothetical protein